MIDKAKRNTLKSAAVAGVAVATASVSATAFAEMVKPVSPNPDISLQVVKGTHSDTVNVVIQNRSNVQKTISRMSPSHISTELGEVNLDGLLEEGPMLLGAKQELVFSMTPADSARTMYNNKPVHIHSSTLLTATSPMHQPKMEWGVA